MAAGSTYTPIATTTLSSATNSVTFSSIVSTYTDLVIICTMTAPTTRDMNLRYNGDSSAIYSSLFLAGNGTSVLSGARTNQSAATIGFYTGGVQTTRGYLIINVFNYANTTTFKSALARSGASDSPIDLVVACYRSTSAINSITLFQNVSGLLDIGSTFTLYGIAAA